MNTYTAYFYTDAEYAQVEIEATTPEEALAKARAIDDADRAGILDFERYSDLHPTNQIEIFDEDGYELAEWQDDDLRCRLAARELLAACRLLVAAYAKGAESQCIDWEDLDLAHEAAQSALAMAEAKP